MSFLTLLDIQKRNGSESDIGLIEEVGRSAPEVTQLASVVGSKTIVKTYVRTGIPRARFRPANAPIGYTSCTYESRNVELFPISSIVFVDHITLESSDDGEAAVLADEASGITEGVLLSLGAQGFYGKKIDKNGFPGLPDFIDDTMIISADSSKAADNYDGTSVFAVVEGPKGVHWRWGRDKGITLGTFKDALIPGKDPETGEPGAIPGKVADLTAFVALVNNSKLSAARLKNIGTAEGTTLDDDKLAELLALFPAGVRVTKFIMNRMALEQLRKSRRVVSVSVDGGKAGGDSSGLAPIPTRAHGIPILVTDSIVNNESDLSSITGISYWGKHAPKKVSNKKNQ